MGYMKLNGYGASRLLSLFAMIAAMIMLLGCADKSQQSWYWDQDSGSKYRVRKPESPSVSLADNRVKKRPLYLDDVNYFDRELKRPVKNAKIVVNKTKRKLYLFEGDRVIKIYPVSLGFDPFNDKVRQGDGRTPEGRFYVCTKNAQSKYHLSLGISYPSLEDAERGLRQGLITKKEYDKIVWAIRHGKRPPWSTKLGGAICIHGGGVAWNWTAGCIALKNSDIEELFRVVPTGTPVIIEKLGTRTAELGHEELKAGYN